MEKMNFEADINIAKREMQTGRREIDFRLDREWDEQEKAAIMIIEKIQSISKEAYFAGGAVRDYINGKKPNDIDLCTSASSNEIEKEFGKLAYYKSDKAKENKIINIKIGGYEFEVATLRKDIFLEDEVSGKIKMLESVGYKKRLMEYGNEYDEFIKAHAGGIEFLDEGEMRKIVNSQGISATEKAGMFRIEDESGMFDILFYKEMIRPAEESEKEDEVNGGAKEEKKQKHVLGRHPDLTITKGVALEDDARRRDFTMNGLFFDPKNNKLIDCVGGYEDVKEKRIRFVGEPVKRIKEDRIRILRFFRFKGLLDLDADQDSVSAIREWFSDEANRDEFREMFYLNQRIKPELAKILRSQKTSDVLDELLNEGILDLIMPEIAKMKGVEQPAEHHAEGDVWEHTKRCLDETISLEEYRKRYSEYDPNKIEREYLDLPGHDRESLLPKEDYINACREKNVKANENKYEMILKQWQGKMPSKEEYVREFSKKNPDDIEREYLELKWSVLLHDAGKVRSKEVSQEEDLSEINFHKHEKASEEIAKFVMLIEKEAKWHRGEGLNIKGERLKGLNYEQDFAKNVIWLVSNHMHHLDFNRMNPTKQRQLMENENFEKLLELWRADIFGSKPLRTENFDAAVKIYEEYKKSRKQERSEEKKEDILKPDELMGIMKESGINIDKGFVKEGSYIFSRAIPAVVEWLNNKYLMEKKKKKIYTKENAKKDIEDLIKQGKIFERIAKDADADHEIIELRNSIQHVSGKKKSKQIDKLSAKINNKANEIFVLYFENMNK